MDRKRNIKKVAMFWIGEILIFLFVLVVVSSFADDWLCLCVISNKVVLLLLSVMTIVTLILAFIFSKSYIKSPRKGTLELLATINVLTIILGITPLETITETLFLPCLGELLVYSASNLWTYIIAVLLCIIGVMMCMFAYMETKEY